MKTQYKNGVLGLDTVKAVMIGFLILAVIGISVILTLTAMEDSTSAIIDIRTQTLSITNETGAYLNVTGYELDAVNSSNSNYAITSFFANASGITYLVPSANYSVSSVGILTNITIVPNATQYNDANVSYTFLNTYSLNRVSSITGNVSSGLVVFFASTDTIFAILIVVVIILAISIIIWAVGRFGNTMENQSEL